ncbi:MAG: hypothetical protein U0704_10435 [Candidatus Eisenbacteria bacterium]
MNAPEHGVADEPGGLSLEQLRARFTSLTRRRVHPDAVEDLVQEALRIVIERRMLDPQAEAGASPRLAACFQTLRNVIGNHYQRERVRGRRLASADAGEAVSDGAPTPLEALESEQAVRTIETALDRMTATDPGCARYLNALAAGASPREVAARETLEETVFYRRVYRCRQKLRAVLATAGYFA